MMHAHAAHWLTAQRLRIYPVIFLGVYALISSSWIMLSSNLIDHHGTPLGTDFITFWSASYIGLHGDPTDAYDILKIHAVEKTVVPGSGSFAWLYPPTFYVAILPLATLPYVISYVVFIVTTLATYLAVMWRVSPTRQALVLALAFPGLLLNIMNGQNAFLTAALAGMGLLLMQTRPILAGMCIGLLAIKPHLALLFPVIMIMTAAWTAMLSAAITCMCVFALSIALLGLPVWETFLHSVSQARQLNELGALPWEKMPTIFSNARVLGISVTSAYIMHGVIALMGTLIMLMVWRRSSDLRLRGSAFVAATFPRI